MKTFLLFVLLFIQVAEVQSQGVGVTKLKFTVTPGEWKKEGRFSDLLVNIKLENPTADTISYVSMSCSWTDFFQTDNKDISCSVPACDKNFPLKRYIAPLSSVNLELHMKAQTANQLSLNKPFRIGFTFIDGSYLQEYINRHITKAAAIIEKNQMLIWSGYIK